jgi:hypothetical protein
MKTVWIVGKYIEKTESGTVWEFEGVFEDQGKAEAACSLPVHFIGPAPINALVGDGLWPGCYYPVQASNEESK